MTVTVIVGVVIGAIFGYLYAMSSPGSRTISRFVGYDQRHLERWRACCSLEGCEPTAQARETWRVLSPDEVPPEAVEQARPRREFSSLQRRQVTIRRGEAWRKFITS